MFNQSRLGWLAVRLLRVALAFSFLSAVADRSGLWGPFGVAGVSWGDFERFTAYTAQLLWFLPPSLVSPAAILSTAAEVIVAGGLLVGWRLHWWAFAAAALLLSFALAMTGALGVKARPTPPFGRQPPRHFWSGWSRSDNMVPRAPATSTPTPANRNGTPGHG